MKNLIILLFVAAASNLHTTSDSYRFGTLYFTIYCSIRCLSERPHGVSSPYSCSLAREYCSSRPDLISHLVDALAPSGVVSILRRSLVPADSNSAGLYCPSLGQKIRTCLTSCFGQPHSQLADCTPGTLHWNRNWANPIFPVRIWIKAELSAFARSLWRVLLDFQSSVPCAGVLSLSGISKR